MKLYFKSQTKEGKIIEGTVDAPERFTLAKQIRARGEVPLEIREQKQSDFFQYFLVKFAGKVRLHEKIIFTRNLSGMLSAGLSLYRALEILEKQTRNEKFKRVLHALLENIDSGGTLSEGMSKFPQVFSTLFVSMVRSGEESGGLAKALTEVGLNLEKTYALNKKIKGALTYPAIILSAIFLIGVLMFIYVVPTLTKTFTELNVKLPASTRFVIGISNFVSHQTLLFFLCIFIVIAFFYTIFHLKSLTPAIDYLIIKLPVIGLMAREANTARTARTLSSLLSSGIDVTKALMITKDVVQNVHYKKVLDEAQEVVQKGTPLSTVFKKYDNLYPIMVGEMMEVGEEAGKMGAMLLDIATFYEDEVDAKTKNLSTIIEPVLMIFIGAAVGFFAISMLTPMYSLVDAIN